MQYIFFFSSHTKLALKAKITKESIIMSNKKNRNQNQNVQQEGKEELQKYFNNPNSGEFENKKLNQNNRSNKL